MTAEIVPFRKRAPKDAAAPVTEEQLEGYRRGSVQEIRSTMDRYPRMRTTNEEDKVAYNQLRRRVANNMWRILEELERSSLPIKTKTVLQKAGLGGENDSTKRLPRYAIDPGLPEEEQNIRAENVTQTIRKYADLARVAAQLSGHDDREYFIPALVEGTRYAALSTGTHTSPVDPAAEAWEAILSMIEAAVRGITEKHKLREYFQKVTSAGIAWGKHDDIILRGKTGRREGYESLQVMPRPNLVSDIDLPPRPSLFLGRTRVSAYLPCDLTFSLADYSGGELQYAYDLLVDRGLDSGSFRGYVEPELFIFLELLPKGREGSIFPHLRFKAMTTFYAAEDYTAFAAVKYPKLKHITLPGPIRKGNQLGHSWQRIEPSTPMEDSEGMEAIVLDERTDDWIELKIEAEFKRELSERYTKNIHAKIPSGGSLVVPLDENAREQLGDRVSHIDVERPYCLEVEHVHNDSKGDRAESAFFDDRSMLAALERSLSSDLGDARLDRLLAKEVKAYVEEAAVELAQHQSSEAAEKRRLKTALSKIREQRDSFAHEYNKTERTRGPTG